MMVLIVEDDDFKRRWLAEAAQEFLPDAEIQTARSVNGGLSKITVEKPDLLLLDMSLTTFDVASDEVGGRPQNFGGLEILRQLDRLGLNLPTIVITQYSKFEKGAEEITIKSLAKDLFDEFPGRVAGVVYYNAAQGRWRPNLGRLLRRVARGAAS